MVQQQPPKYSDIQDESSSGKKENDNAAVTSGRTATSEKSVGIAKTSLNSHERRMLEDMTLISRHAAPQIAVRSFYKHDQVENSFQMTFLIV